MLQNGLAFVKEELRQNIVAEKYLLVEKIAR